MTNAGKIETEHTNRDIRIGVGCIVYAGRDGSGLTPGWVLPGGMRTSSEQVAREYAARIDAICRRVQLGFVA